MISSVRRSYLLPWLAAAVLLLYIVLLALRFTLPPAKIAVEIPVRQGASSN
jgi:hypothetical protein